LVQIEVVGEHERPTWGEHLGGVVSRHPTAYVGFPGDEQWQGWGEFRTSKIGPLFFRNALPVNADGTFELGGVLPGDYQIFFSREGEKGHIAAGKFQIPAESTADPPPAKDIGEFAAKTGG
jgi:hypothetical protein